MDRLEEVLAAGADRVVVGPGHTEADDPARGRSIVQSAGYRGVTGWPACMPR